MKASDFLTERMKTCNVLLSTPCLQHLSIPNAYFSTGTWQVLSKYLLNE